MHRPAKLPATIYGGQERRAAPSFDVIGFMKRIAGANNKRNNQHTTQLAVMMRKVGAEHALAAEKEREVMRSARGARGNFSLSKPSEINAWPTTLVGSPAKLQRRRYAESVG